MINLQELSLSDLIPSSIAYDKEISAIMTALDKELQAITASVNEVSLMSRIDELPEDIIDLLAFQFHVDFYEPLGLDIEKKRQLVKNSLSWHRRKGTKSVLREILSILFLSDFEIQEWFEYDGEPFYFRIVSNDFVDNREDFLRMISAVNEVKNERSWLQEIVVRTEARSETQVNAAVSEISSQRIPMKLLGDISCAADVGIYTGFSEFSVQRIPARKFKDTSISAELSAGAAVFEAGYIRVPMKALSDTRM